MAIPDANNYTLIIVGAGGSGREVAWLATETFGTDVQLTFAVERNFMVTDQVDGIPVRTLDADSFPTSQRYALAIGNPTVRARLATACDSLGLTATAIVHPRVERSSLVEIGAGSLVCAGTVLTTNVRLGRHVHVNVGCTISHDVELGDFATLSPGVHVSGHVRIEAGAFIGTGANIINGSLGTPLIIGSGAIVAAGACVIGPVEAGRVVAGVPAVRKL